MSGLFFWLVPGPTLVGLTSFFCAPLRRARAGGRWFIPQGGTSPRNQFSFTRPDTLSGLFFCRELGLSTNFIRLASFSPGAIGVWYSEDVMSRAIH